MRVLILGGSGMLGHKMFQVLAPNHDCHATFRTESRLRALAPICQDQSRLHAPIDATRFQAVERLLSKLAPQVVVNCIGIIKQLKEAKDARTSIEVNALFPHRLAEWCRPVGARLFHFSTDCVFSGRKGGYREDDFCDASDLYGRTKCLGEVAQEGCLTIRTSIIGWDLIKADGLLEWFFSQRDGRIQGYSKAFFNGLSTEGLARIVAHLISHRPERSGLYHVSSASISKYDLLCRLRDEMKLQIEIEPSDQLRLDRSLDSSRFWSETDCRAPNWDEMVARLAQERTDYDRWKK